MKKKKYRLRKMLISMRKMYLQSVVLEYELIIQNNFPMTQRILSQTIFSPR